MCVCVCVSVGVCVCVCVLKGSRSNTAETLILLCSWLLTVWQCNYAERTVKKTVREGQIDRERERERAGEREREREDRG